MPLQIFVEDQLSDAYEALALRALNLPTSPRNRSRVRASRIDPEELGSQDGLLDLLRLAVTSGYDCVIFILDQEDPLASPERRELLVRFRQAFAALCDYQQRLRANDPLRRARVIRVICTSCLEGWLAADPKAVVDSVRGSHGINYSPPPQNTDGLLPVQAADRIAHFIREAGRRLQRHDLERVSKSSVKSRGKSIAERLEPDRARAFNSSLDYFFSMADCRRSGCDHPQQ